MSTWNRLHIAILRLAVVRLELLLRWGLIGLMILAVTPVAHAEQAKKPRLRRVAIHAGAVVQPKEGGATFKWDNASQAFPSSITAGTTWTQTLPSSIPVNANGSK